MISQSNVSSTSSFRSYQLSAALLLFLIAFSVIPVSNAQAQQKQVDILNASRIIGGTYQGQQVRRILGNVHIRHKDLEMYADSAYQFINKSEIRAFGNIEIDTGTEKIWTDSLTYFTDTDFSKFRGRVVLEADSTTIFGNSMNYSFVTKVAHFIDKIRYEDPSGTLKADSGYYYRRSDSLQFHGRVQLVDSLQYLEGDSLYGNRRTEYYELHGNIFGDDQKNDSMLKGEYLETDSTGRRRLEGNAWLKNFKADSSDTTKVDTTHIRAQTIISQEQRSATDTSAIIHAYENVRIWSPDFSAISDTSKYTDSKQTFELWSNAKSWHKQVQLTGPYIKAILNNGNIDSLKSYPQPFSVQKDTAINRLNQITGDTLHADFTAGNLKEIHVFKNAKLLRFTKNKQDSSDGAIELSAPSIRIIFEGGEVDSLKAMGPNKGSFLPENEQTAQKKLEGFSWDPDQRPQKPKQPMKRRFPPIKQELFFELPKRYIEHLRKTDPTNPRLPDESPKPNFPADSTKTDSTAAN